MRNSGESLLNIETVKMKFEFFNKAQKRIEERESCPKSKKAIKSSVTKLKLNCNTLTSNFPITFRLTTMTRLT